MHRTAVGSRLALLALPVALMGCEDTLEDVGDFFTTLFRAMYVVLAVMGLGGVAFNVWRVLGERRTFYPLLFAVPLFLGDGCLTAVVATEHHVLGPTARLAMWCLCLPVAFVISSVLLPWAAPAETHHASSGHPLVPGGETRPRLPQSQRIVVAAIAAVLAIGYAAWTFAFLGSRRAPPIATITRMRVTRDRGCAVHETGELGCWEPYKTLSKNAGNFDVSGQYLCWIDRGGPIKCYDFGGAFDARAWDVNVLDAVDVSLSSPFGCALVDVGAVHCWALLGGSPSYLKPAMVEGIDHAVQIALNYDRGCALEEDGRVACWTMPKQDSDPRDGRSASASGSASASAPPIPVTSAAPPIGSSLPIRRQRVKLIAQQVAELEPASGVGVGQDHACALLRDGRVKCWGDSNQFGVLGPGVTFAKAPVAIPLLSQVMQLAVGLTHNCVLKRDGSVWCWGYRDDGLIGNGEGSVAATQTTPVTVELPGKASALHISRYATCARIEDELYCWGTNDKKELSVDLREECGGEVEVDFCTPRPSRMRWP